MTRKNRIMIYGPKDDGTYVVEFMTADGDVLAISIPSTEAHVIRHFQERMPYGLCVPDEYPQGGFCRTRAPGNPSPNHQGALALQGLDFPLDLAWKTRSPSHPWSGLFLGRSPRAQLAAATKILGGRAETPGII
jgi:hypothetical protein